MITIMGIRGRAARRAAAALALTAALALGGCGLLSLNQTETARIYDLTPITGGMDTLPYIDSQLVIEVPIATRALDSDRIAVRRSDFEIGYFSGVRWSDRATRLVQTHLVASFEDSGRVKAVGRQAIGLRADYTLKTELREFQAEIRNGSDGPEVTVTLNAKLIAIPAASIVASETFTQTIRLDSDKFTDTIQGFDTALDGVIEALVAWSVERMQAHEADSGV